MAPDELEVAPTLKSLTVNQFRDVEATRLYFHKRRNILLGKNGSGKTTLLDLISMIVRSDFTSVARAEFDIEYELEISESRTLRVQMKNSREEGPQGPSPRVRELEQEIPFKTVAEVHLIDGSGKSERVLEFKNNQVQAFRPGINERFLSRNPLGPNFLQSIATGIHSGVFRTWNADRFDEGISFYREIFSSGSSRAVLTLDKENRPLQLSGRFLPELLVGQFFEPEGLEGKTLRWGSERIPFLRTLCQLMGFSEAEYSIEPQEKRSLSSDSQTRIVYENYKVKFFWSKGGFVSNDNLSYGQKRLLALLHYLACNPMFVIADEIVNGLHHEWIAFCLNEIGDRQAFLTSQNPLLFDHLAFENAADVSQQFVVCTTVPGSSRPRLLWKQLDSAKASQFYASYERGIQYVSEILQTEGLW
jgi:energy-coupling factor transporter ATP-binding protein EcfA2